MNVEWSTSDRNNKEMYSWFYESKKFLGCLMYREKRVNWKKTENGENIFFKALADRFWLTSMIIISRVKEQQI